MDPIADYPLRAALPNSIYLNEGYEPLGSILYIAGGTLNAFFSVSAVAANPLTSPYLNLDENTGAPGSGGGGLSPRPATGILWPRK